MQERYNESSRSTPTLPSPTQSRIELCSHYSSLGINNLTTSQRQVF